MTERERENEILKYQLRDLEYQIRGLARQFSLVMERYCNYIDNTEALVKFHERNTMAMAQQLDANEDAKVIG